MTETTITGTAISPPVLRGGEGAYLALGVLAFVAVVAMSGLRDQAIDWTSFLPGYGASLGLLAIGFYIRIVKGADRFAAAIVALAGYGLFGISMGIFFHIFMPRPDPILDDLLLRFDHFFGYHWPDAVSWLAREYAWIGRALSHLYGTSFAQLIVVIVVLAERGHFRRLHHLLLTGMIGLILTFVVWQAFPNFSMGIHFPIPPEAEQAIRLVTDTRYGAMLRDAAINGIPVISNDTILGAVAFPSYHSVMACLVVWFLIGTVAFWPGLIANVAMIPAIHIHGAHHILDVVGGIGIFFTALWLSGLILARLPDR